VSTVSTNIDLKDFMTQWAEYMQSASAYTFVDDINTIFDAIREASGVEYCFCSWLIEGALGRYPITSKEVLKENGFYEEASE
jgi:hypothetical protein